MIISFYFINMRNVFAIFYIHGSLDNDSRSVFYVKKVFKEYLKGVESVKIIPHTLL